MNSEKFLPIDTLREYHIRKKDVDTLEKADIWDSLLVGNNKDGLFVGNNNKERLNGIGFPDDVAVKISNAIDEIMDKLTTRVNNFFQRIEPHFEERLKGTSDEEMRAVILASRECFEKCLSFSEMHEYLGARFSQMKPQATIKVYEFYTGMKGGNSYKQLSVVRASQRKEKKRLTQASVQDDQKTPESVQDDQPTQQSVQDDQPTQQSVESVQDDLQDDQPTRGVDSEQPEQPEEIIFPIDTLLRYGVGKKDVTKLQEAGIWDSLLVGNNNKALLCGMGFSDEKAVKICDAIDRIRTNQAKPRDLSQILSQLFTSQTRMGEAISSQREMVDTLMGLQMETATKEELSSVQRDLFGKLQTVGTDISVQVATNIQATLTSGSDKAINIFEKVVISKLKKAINKLQTSVQESIKISDSAKTSQKSPSMDGTEEMAVLLGEGDYEQCFTMALEIHDDASLYWLLSKVQPNQLLEPESFQLSQQTLWALLERLLDCGFFCFTTETLLIFAWFKAVTKAIITDRNISGDAGKVLAEAVRVVQDKIQFYVNSGLLVDNTVADEIRFFKLKTGAIIPFPSYISRTGSA